MKNLFLIISFIFIAAIGSSHALAGQHLQYTFFANTQYPLKVHFLKGDMPGPTILVQGGIQGDEPAGFITAQILTQAKMQKGNIIIVPRANLPSIHCRQRQINRDMNRRFDRDYGQFYEDILARAIRHLLASCDGLIHLHEGSGFYNPKYKDSLHGPHRYGQSVIIDTAKYGNLYLGKMVQKVLNGFNPSIIPQKYRFHLFNTKTIEDDSPYLEQRKSLTYYVLTKLKIPALAIEVSKNISDLEWKVTQQLKLTHAFLKQMGLELKEQSIEGAVKNWFVCQSKLLVNGHSPVHGRVRLSPYTLLQVRMDRSQANLAWGVFASDRKDYNLLAGSRFLMSPFEKLLVFADGKKVGSIDVEWEDKWPQFGGDKPVFVYSLNGRYFTAKAGAQVKACEGDRLVLEGIWQSAKDEILNAKGFSASRMNNNGQDLGLEILLSREMFMPRYIQESNEGWKLAIVRETHGESRSEIELLISPQKPRLLAVRDEQKKTVICSLGVSEQELHKGIYKFEGIWPTSSDQKFYWLNELFPYQAGQELFFSQSGELYSQLCGASDFRALGAIKMRIR